jgi:hypothetical protein
MPDVGIETITIVHEGFKRADLHVDVDGSETFVFRSDPVRGPPSVNIETPPAEAPRHPSAHVAISLGDGTTIEAVEIFISPAASDLLSPTVNDLFLL